MEPTYCPNCGKYHTLERDVQDGEDTTTARSPWGDHYLTSWKCTACGERFIIC